MLICKVCGAANASNTAVCSSCGTSLSRKEKETHSNEIFSSKDTGSTAGKSTDFNEIYSTRSGYDEAQQKKIFEKIRKQEEALGDTEKNIKTTVKENIQPTVVNDSKKENTGSKSKPSSSKNHKIPQRIIESVDKQMIQQKIKPTTKYSSDSESEDEKVELTSSKVIEEIHEKHEHTLQMRKLKAEQQKQGKKKNNALSNSKGLQRKKEKALEKEQNEKLKQFEKKRQLEEKQAIKAEKQEEKIAKKNKNSVVSPKNDSSVQQNSNVPKRRSISSTTNNQVKNNVQPTAASNKNSTNVSFHNDYEKTHSAKNVSADKNRNVPQKNSYSVPKRTMRNDDSSVATKASKVAKESIKKNVDKVNRNVNPSNTVIADTQQSKKRIDKKSNGNQSIKTFGTAVDNDNQLPNKKVNSKQSLKQPATQSKSVNANENKRVNELKSAKITNKNPSVAEKTKTNEFSDDSNVIKDSSKSSTKKKNVKTEKTYKNKNISLDAGVKTKKSKKKKVKNVINYNFTDEDISENKYIAALSYIGILFLIPFARRNKSDFCKAHAKQGFLLFLISVIFLVITLAMVIGLRFLLVWFLGLPYIIYSILYYLVILGAAALIFIPVFKGAEGAINGTYIDIPFIGKIVRK